MTEKVVIKPEQVVSRKGGNISYINEQSTLVQAKESTVIVQGESEASAAPAEESFPVDIPERDEPAPEVPPHVVAATENPKSEDTKTPRKGRAKKVKETVVASSAAKKAPAAKKVPAKTAPKKAPAKAPKEAGVRTIGGKPVDISEYQKSKAPGGGTSYNNGDAVADLLSGKDLDACYKISAQKLKLDEKDLRKQYSHLNVGMQRMNLGNRLRKLLIPKDAKK